MWKIIPNTWQDEWWIKFHFNDNGKHYTIRFWWKPILLLEALYNKRWWKDFYHVYNMCKTQEWKNKLETTDKNTYDLLVKCVHEVHELLWLFIDIDKNLSKCWLVVYSNIIKDFN